MNARFHKAIIGNTVTERGDILVIDWNLSCGGGGACSSSSGAINKQRIPRRIIFFKNESTLRRNK